ncbi:MAG: exonuclease SbcCD subunit D [Clostridia bacterium]|nr:exonuclease SbcCD subunit D [Clostridia bacterium]
MRLLHTADWHLGKIVYGKSMLEDQKDFIYKFLLPLTDETTPDAIMISGDVFDRSIAPADAIKLFDDFVEEICIKRNIKLLVSLGNHDGADRFSLGEKLLRNSGFYISSKLQGEIQPITLCDDDCKVNIYMLPFFDVAAAKQYMSDDSLSSADEAFSAVVKTVTGKLDENAVNIAMAHCYVSGSKLRSDGGYVGSLEPLDTAVLSPFDYVALGHLHEQQQIGENAAYSGSPLKYSFDEEHQKKGVFMLDISRNNIEITAIPIVPTRDMRSIKGSFDELISAAQKDENNQDYIYARITGTPVFEPMAKLKEFYPNILGLINGEEETQASDDRAGLREELRRTKPDKVKLFTSFLQQICGVEATDEDVEIFNSVAENLGGESK